MTEITEAEVELLRLWVQTSDAAGKAEAINAVAETGRLVVSNVATRLSPWHGSERPNLALPAKSGLVMPDVDLPDVRPRPDPLPVVEPAAGGRGGRRRN